MQLCTCILCVKLICMVRHETETCMPGCKLQLTSSRREFWCVFGHKCSHATHCTFHGQETILLHVIQVEIYVDVAMEQMHLYFQKWMWCLPLLFDGIHTTLCLCNSNQHFFLIFDSMHIQVKITNYPANTALCPSTVLPHKHANQLIVLPVLLVMMHCCYISNHTYLGVRVVFRV